MNKFLRLFKKGERKSLTAQNARDLFEFGSKNLGIEKIIKKEIKDIEYRIEQTCRFNNSRFLCIPTPNSKLQLTIELQKHFKEEGFVVKIEEFAEIPDYHILILGW